jgi:hypothetical protein
MRKSTCSGAIAPVGGLLMALAAIGPLQARPSGGGVSFQDPVPPPIQNPAIDNILKAETIVIGKVKSIESDPVIAAAAPSDAFKSVYKVAVVGVDEAVLGAGDAKTVRVGFRLVHNPQLKNQELAVDQEAIFFLWKHPDEAFLVAQQPAPTGFGFGGGGFGFGAYGTTLIDKKSPNFAKDAATLKLCGKVLADPKAGLQSKEPQERLLTAALLISRYRTPPPLRSTPGGVGGLPVLNLTPPKTEPIDAEESRLILETLANADLIRTDSNLRVSPLGLFFKLGLQPADGYRRPETVFEIPDSARKWLKENAATYRIQRYVSAEKVSRGG